MKKKQKQVMETLNEKEQKDIMGGFAPPTDEQKKEIRERYGLLADVICW